MRGIAATYCSERNFKIHLAVSIVAITFGLWLRLSASDWLWIALCISLVLSIELLNTALESLVDLASPTYHPLAKKAKDASAGAVLIVAIFSVIVGCIVFLPKLAVLLFD